MLVGPGDGGPGGVPGGSFLRGVAGGLRSDGLGVVVPSVELAVGADVSGAGLPVEPVERVIGNRSEGAVAQAGECSAANSPIRVFRSSMAAAISVR